MGNVNGPNNVRQAIRMAQMLKVAMSAHCNDLLRDMGGACG